MDVSNFISQEVFDFIDQLLHYQNIKQTWICTFGSQTESFSSLFNPSPKGGLLTK